LRTLPAGTRLPWDWYDGLLPVNVLVDEDAYLETTYSLLNMRSKRADAVRIERGAAAYAGTMFDVGPRGRVRIAPFAFANSVRIIADALVEIGEYSMLSWNVVLMDSYRATRDPASRRAALTVQSNGGRLSVDPSLARPVRIGRCVWIGFDAIVLPGVTIGDGAVIGAKSVVFEDVRPYAVVAGNPARELRRLAPLPGPGEHA
jgi:acetyltransferase-like isoleucine patch superfamily enzyme